MEQIVNELTVSYKTIGKNPYDGVTIDLRPAQRQYRDLRPVPDGAGQPGPLSGQGPVCLRAAGADHRQLLRRYNIARITALSDKVILMTYDYEDRTMAQGPAPDVRPTSPMDQVYWSVKTAVEQVSAASQDVGKLVLGYSCKNVAWKVNSATDLTLAASAPFYVSNETLSQRLSQNGTAKGWSDRSQCPYASTPPRTAAPISLVRR